MGRVVEVLAADKAVGEEVLVVGLAAPAALVDKVAPADKVEDAHPPLLKHLMQIMTE
jgi:hypothetical protein